MHIEIGATGIHFDTDRILAYCELIAEAWDAARRFLRGDDNTAGEMVQRIMGSPDLYQSSGRKPCASVNFITCHDGFTLADLFAYSKKHNLENGEDNRDGIHEPCEEPLLGTQPDLTLAPKSTTLCIGRETL